MSKLSRRQLLHAAAGLSSGLVLREHAIAAELRLMRIVVPFPPGGLTDSLARALAQDLETKLQIRVLVENRAGASGNIGTDLVAKASADGSTVGMVIGTHTMNPSVMKEVLFDPVKDFSPVALVARSPHVLVVGAQKPFSGLRDFLAAAQARPQGVSFATTTNRLQTAQLEVATGVRFNSVPYRGSAPALIDVIGGQVDAMFVTPTTGASQMKTGRVKALAVSSQTRLQLAPEVPTFRELGIDFLYDEWWGLVGPAGMQTASLQRLEKAVIEVVTEWKKAGRFAEQGVLLDAKPSAWLGGHLQSEVSRWAELAVRAGLEKE